MADAVVQFALCAAVVGGTLVTVLKYNAVAKYDEAAAKAEPVSEEFTEETMYFAQKVTARFAPTPGTVRCAGGSSSDPLTVAHCVCPVAQSGGTPSDADRVKSAEKVFRLVDIISAGARDFLREELNYMVTEREKNLRVTLPLTYIPWRGECNMRL